MSILVLDIGTTSMRGILYEKNGEKIALSRRDNHLVFLGDSLIEEDPQEFADNTLSIIQELLQTYPADLVEAVAVTSQRSSIIPVDISGHPLLPTIMWQDTRNRSICNELSVYNARLFQLTGAEVSTVFSGSKMTWIRRNQPEIYQRVHKFLNIPEYVCFGMTGRFVSDTTYASRTGLFDLRRGYWHPELLRLYEVEEDKLCELIEPGETAGHITETYAGLSGLKAGIPVLHCGGDQQCAAIGHGILEEGDLSITMGTGGFIAAACDRLPPTLPERMIWNRSSIAGHFIMEANVLSCGAALEWCARELYGMEVIDYGRLEEEIRKENFVSSCLVVPYFSGRGAPDWDPEARAVFANITTATRRSEIFKSTMESIFMEIAGHLNDFEREVPIRNIYCGGGMTASPALNQLQADVYGRPVICTDDPEATGLGCLTVALAGLGEYTSAAEAWKHLSIERKLTEYKPDLRKNRQYEDKRRQMEALYQSVRRGNRS